MVIDLVKCIGCAGCQLACKAEHCLPPDTFWARVLVTESGTYPNSSKVIYPVLCFHCKEPPCERVCPTGATAKQEDGIVTVDYDKCIGCRYCMMACPYGARYFSEDNWEYFPGQGLTPYEEQGYPQYQTGVVSKCTFCQERIDEGLRKGLKPGCDREATPACVINCMCQARYFGDLDDPESEVSQLIRARRGFTLRPELGTEPSVYYLR
jgi:Fe-S-cluster-containing dehydrogenase component